MKKVLVVLMALVLTMAMFCANAEVKNFAFGCVTDMEGNVIEGDFSAYEAATMAIDDEAMTLVFNDGTNPETNYTLEMIESTEEAVALNATAEDGSETIQLYVAAAEDGTMTTSMIVEDIIIIFVEA